VNQIPWWAWFVTGYTAGLTSVVGLVLFKLQQLGKELVGA
jgi:hypothetical protein